MYSSKNFSIFTDLCNHCHSLILEHFQHPQINFVPTYILSHSHSPSQATTNLLSISPDFPCVGISYTRNHIICGLCVQLLSLSIICPQVHPYCSVHQPFTAFYCQIIFHCMILHFIMYMGNLKKINKYPKMIKRTRGMETWNRLTDLRVGSVGN